MFSESSAKEFTLKDIDPKDFLEFLSAIYPTRNAVTGTGNAQATCVFRAWAN